MKRILCYGDSNTWGYDPVNTDPATGLPARYDENTRWPCVMQKLLGDGYYVWEAGLGGRTTVFDDPLMPTRNGVRDFEMVLQTCDPVDCIIFALGTNDTKDMFHASSLVITRAMERVLQVCKSTLMQSRSPDAKIIIACPVIPVAAGTGEYLYGFSKQSTQTGEELREKYAQLADEHGCAYIDINSIAMPSPADGAHLDPDGHKRLAIEMAQLVQRLIG